MRQQGRAHHAHRAEEVGAPPRIHQRHLLRRAHDERAGKRQLLTERYVRVARARRHVNHQQVQRWPGGASHQLLQRAHHHRPSPGCCLAGLEQEAHAHADNSVRGGRLHQPLLVQQWWYVRQSQQQWHRRPVHVRVQQAHAPTSGGGGDGHVRRRGALPDSAFAGGDSHNVRHPRDGCSRFVRVWAERGCVALAGELTEPGQGPLRAQQLVAQHDADSKSQRKQRTSRAEVCAAAGRLDKTATGLCNIYAPRNCAWSRVLASGGAEVRGTSPALSVCPAESWQRQGERLQVQRSVSCLQLACDKLRRLFGVRQRRKHAKVNELAAVHSHLARSERTVDAGTLSGKLQSRFWHASGTLQTRTFTRWFIPATNWLVNATGVNEAKFLPSFSSHAALCVLQSSSTCSVTSVFSSPQPPTIFKQSEGGRLP
jgi:hypothetical protein